MNHLWWRSMAVCQRIPFSNAILPLSSYLDALLM